MNFLTVDVEEHFEEAKDRSIIYPSRLADQLHRVLELLRDEDSKATFFFLGERARENPKLVREIADAGHEIGSHSSTHEFLYKMPFAKQEDEVRRSIRTIEDILGAKVVSFRAPYFSVMQSNARILKLLAQEGIAFDSSIFPCSHPDYGWPGTPTTPYRISLSEGRSIIELPPSTFSFGPWRLGVGGGAYLRFFPLWLTMRTLGRMSARGSPLVLYFHPWELDPSQPRMPLRLHYSVRHYYNLSKTEGRLRAILKSHKFAPCRDASALSLPEVPMARMIPSNVD
ncbi:MAG: polysaccharide deacetylase family protein [Candidatus Brocadiia bacterium]